MDILAGRAYLHTMIARFVTMLVILAFTVVTTGTSAHAAQMGLRSSPEHTTHVARILHGPAMAEPACEAAQPCESADAGMCDFACAGLSVFLTSPVVDAGQVDRSAAHDFPSEASHVGRAPALNERPPKLRLL